MLLADLVSFTERPTDVIGPAVNPVDFFLFLILHMSLNTVQMELMMDLRGLLIEIEEIPVPTPVVEDNRVHLLHGAIV